MTWEETIERAFNRLVDGMIASAEADSPPDGASKLAIQMLSEQRESAYLIFFSGWVAAMSFTAEWAAIQAGDSDIDDEEDAEP